MTPKAKPLATVCAALFAAVFLVFGCAPKRPAEPAPLDTPADMWAELETLKSQTRKLNAELEELRYQQKSAESGGASLPDLAQRVARLESNQARMASQLALDIDGGAAGVSSGAAPYGASHAVAGQAPQPGSYPSAASGALDDGYDDGGMSTALDPQPTTRSAPTQQSPVVIAPPLDPADALYTKALQSFNNRQYAEALSMWREFVKNFPKNALVPNTYFWIGECYFQQNDFANAVLSYQEVIDKYPKSGKYPDAMFKRGAAFLKLGNKQAARLSLQEVIDKFPNTPYAARAKSIMPPK